MARCINKTRFAVYIPCLQAEIGPGQTGEGKLTLNDRRTRHCVNESGVIDPVAFKSFPGRGRAQAIMKKAGPRPNSEEALDR